MTKVEGIYTLPDFLSLQECAAFIKLSEGSGYEAASLATVDGPRLQPEVRNNDRVILDDPEMACEFWLRVAPHLPKTFKGRQAVGLNERFRFYRYDPGQQFAGHIDAPYRRANGESSQLTFMVYLNDNFTGGETTFDEAAISPVSGMALIFSQDLFHAGTPVSQGRKYVLRSDVMYNPPGRFSA